MNTGTPFRSLVCLLTAILGIGLFAAGTAQAQFVFDDFENEDVSGYGEFSETGQGVTVSTETGDAPAENGGSASLLLEIDGDQAGSFAGVTTSPLDTGYDPNSLDNSYLNFYVKSDASSEFSLGIFLQEDQNGDGSFDPDTEDEVVDNIRVTPTGSGYQLVSIPVASFLDSDEGTGDNTFTDLIQIAFTATGYPSESFEVNLDYLAFTSGPLANPENRIVFEDYEDNNPSPNHFPFGDATLETGDDEPTTTDVPSQNGGSYALDLNVDGTNGNGFAGTTITSQVSIDPTANEYVNLYYRSNASSTYRLQIFLQEDENGDGSFNPDSEDDFKAEYQVEPGSGYDLISVPITAFRDDNSAGDGELTEPVNQMAFTVIGYGSAQFTINMDYISATTPGALPVELSGFDGRRDGNSALLSWRTLSETNNAGFEVGHKEPGATTFEVVGFVPSKVEGGTSTQKQSYSYRVENLDPGTHEFRLYQKDYSESGRTSSEPVTIEVGVDGAYRLENRGSNPFRKRTHFSLAVQRTQEVRVSVYDVLGRQVRTLHDGTVEAKDTRDLMLEASGLSSGVYFVRFEGKHFSAVRQVVLSR
jgi:hypothetical protein